MGGPMISGGMRQQEELITYERRKSLMMTALCLAGTAQAEHPDMTDGETRVLLQAFGMAFSSRY